MKRLCAALAFALLVSCKTAPQPKPAATQPIRLTLVATNDWHGWVMPLEESGIKRGGFAAFAGYLKILREKNPSGVLLLDAGDLFQGTLISNLSEGEVVVEAMNVLGYDAVAIGNHEFDFGPVGPAVLAQRPSEDAFGALKARIEQARFPVLSANIFERDSHRRPSWLKGDGTVMVQREGLKIGIVGLTTPQTPQTTLPQNVASLQFEELPEVALRSAEGLRKSGADLVVAVMHAGGKCASHENPHDIETCDTQTAEVFSLLAAIPEATFDAVVAGHVHAQIGHVFRGTPVIESPGMGKSFGTIELFVDPARRKVIRELTQIRPDQPICETVDEETQSCESQALKGRSPRPVPARYEGAVVTADAQVAALVQKAQAQVRALQEKPLGLTLQSQMWRNYEAESALGNLISDSLRQMEKADVALVNPGGLRADLKAKQLAYGDVFEVLPFENAIATLTVTGDELMTLLTAAYHAKKGVFQMSGLKLTLASCRGERSLKEVTLDNGKPISRHASYRVVMSDFLARGGDGLKPMVDSLDSARVDLGQSRNLNFRDALIAYWQAKPEALKASPLGRIKIVKDVCPAQ